jgi:Tol biopolymer transport system component
VVFGSERAGIGRQIWIGKMDGSGTIAITQPTTRAQGAPRWSQDGRWIAYGEQTAEGTRQVIIMDTSGGRRTRLTADTANEGMPSWSHDDRFVYFGSDRTGRPEIWRAPFQRAGTIEQITFAGGIAAFESADGASVFYTKANGGESPLFMKPLTGTSETTVVPSVFRSDFVPVDDGLYYISHARPGRQDDFELCYLDLRTRLSSVLSHFQAADVVGLTVSPDRRTIVTSAVRAAASYDLAWIASFR